MPKYKLSDDGNEVYMLTEKGERKIDPAGLASQVSELEGIAATLREESKSHRQGKAAVTKQLESFTSVLGENKIEDAVAALASVTKLESGHQLNLEKATRSLAEQHAKKLDVVESAYKSQVGELTDTLSNYVQKFTKELHFNRLLRSEVLNKTRYNELRSDAYSRFGSFFNADGTYSDRNGAVIPSMTNPGQPAEIDEALEVLIDSDPESSRIWTKPEARGTGGQGASGGQFHVPLHQKSAAENIADGMKKKFA